MDMQVGRLLPRRAVKEGEASGYCEYSEVNRVWKASRDTVWQPSWEHSLQVLGLLLCFLLCKSSLGSHDHFRKMPSPLGTWKFRLQPEHWAFLGPFPPYLFSGWSPSSHLTLLHLSFLICQIIMILYLLHQDVFERIKSMDVKTFEKAWINTETWDNRMIQDHITMRVQCRPLKPL